jgi:glutaredoxin
VSETLTLYTRAGCPLCDDMAAEVNALLAGSGHALAAVDVDADPALATRFGWDVPLLFDGEREICRHRLDPAALHAWLAGHA